jgi:hypothetical protein
MVVFPLLLFSFSLPSHMCLFYCDLYLRELVENWQLSEARTEPPLFGASCPVITYHYDLECVFRVIVALLSMPLD